MTRERSDTGRGTTKEMIPTVKEPGVGVVLDGWSMGWKSEFVLEEILRWR